MLALATFYKNIRGNVGLTFALLILPIATLAGGAVDLFSASSKKAQISSALDAALLAGATKIEVDSETAISEAVRYFDANAPVSPPITRSFNVSNDIIRGSAQTQVPTNFLGLIGIRVVTVRSEAAATASVRGGMELAIVVDVSGSMRGSIPALRSSITRLLDTIYDGSDTRNDTYVSIIPFSGRVNVTNYGRGWFSANQVPNSSAYSTVGSEGVTSYSATSCKITSYSASYPRLCAARRSGSSQWDDSLPSTEMFRLFAGPAETCPVPRAQGLITSRATLQRVTDNLCAGHGTSTQEGMAWGWRAVSPRWKGHWGRPDLPLSRDKSPGKIVIIMTDGNNHPSQAGDTITVSQSNTELLRTCATMKSEGITIFAITYNMGGTLSSLYRQCTSRPEYEIAAESPVALNNAFVEIGSRIGKVQGVRLIE